MARRYDSATTTFSPEGRLYQVEYAMEAIGQGGTSLGIRTKNGVILAVEKKHVHKLLDDDPSLGSDKLYQISGEAVCAVAGFTADANVLINEIRLAAERYRFQYGSSMPLEQLVIHVCNIKQYYTQYGGQRPFGVAFLFAGYDKRHGFQLYQSDPSGNYGGWKATCIGNNSATAQSILKTDWKEDLDLDGGIGIALKILNKTLDVQKLSADRFELAQLKLDEETGESKFSFLSEAEKTRRCDILAKEIEEQKKEAARKLKEQQRKDQEAAAKSQSSSSKK